MPALVRTPTTNDPSPFFFLNAKQAHSCEYERQASALCKEKQSPALRKHYGACHHELVNPGTMNTFSH